MNLNERDLGSVLHPFTDLKQLHAKGFDLVITDAHGVYVTDTGSKTYIDAFAGQACVTLGYNHPSLIDALRSQASLLSYAHIHGGVTHALVGPLADKLKRISPMPISKVLFTTSGSEANDTQIKLVWLQNNIRHKPLKKKIIAFNGSLHGCTLGASSLTGLPQMHTGFDLPLSFVRHIDPPDYRKFGLSGETPLQFAERQLSLLKTFIELESGGPETIAAIIVEPILAGAGVVIPGSRYFHLLQSLCATYDIALIVDESITGFGRTGNWWGSETYSITPDSITLAKGMTSGYFPMGAVTISQESWEAIQELGSFQHGFTAGAHPVGCSVALAVIDVIEQTRLIDHVNTMGALFDVYMRMLKNHQAVLDTRYSGLLGAVQLQKYGASALVCKIAQEEGVLFRPIGPDCVGISPPLIITDEELTRVFEALKRALDRAWLHW